MANIPQEFNNFLLKDVSFVNLMTRRIFNVLIVANPYDAFMLEDDGRVDEKIFDEYTELGLRYPPTFTQVSTTEEATHVLQTTSIDLVICMPGTADNDAFTVAREVKTLNPDVPCVVLTPFSHGITRRHLLLAGQHKPDPVDHQAHRGQDEPGPRHRGGRRAGDSARGGQHPLLFVHPA